MKKILLCLLGLLSIPIALSQTGGGIQGGINLTTGIITGSLGVVNGGTGLTAAADDNLLVGNGTVWQSKAVPDCQDTSGSHLNYTASTNAFSCGVSGSFSGTSVSLGGGALLAGACASNTTTVTGATTSMAAVASPNTYPGDGSTWSAQVTSANTVTTRVCAVVALTPTASTYNIRVIR